IGVGVAMASPTKGEFRFVKGCFYSTAALFTSTVLGTFWFYREGPATLRILIAALAGALILGGLVAALDWVRGKETDSAMAQDNPIPPGSGGRGGDAKVGGSGIAVGGPGGRGGRHG